ncbi:MAG: sarcosine oxidase subunit alpha family protein [Pseudomonadota bacterium]
MQKYRLAEGGLVDRSQALTFQFHGNTYQGYVGDSLASALLANGVSIVGRSFKYHRPRGIVGAGAEEPNAIVQLGVGAESIPNAKATQIELFEGLTAKATRGWPSPGFDLGAINDLLSPVFGAGFYYKTFMFPKNFWEHYEHFIRRAAGFGLAPTENDPHRYAHHNAHCDILVVGGGPSGLMSALVSGATGARVLLVDDQWQFGGSLLSQSQIIDGKPGTEWVSSVVQKLQQMENVTCLSRATAFGFYDHNFVTVLEQSAPGSKKPADIRQRLWRVRAQRVILAQGAFERPLVFSNNDRPGVMLASAVSTYVNRYGVCPGNRGLVFCNNDSAYETAFELKAAGADVVAIIDSRKNIAESLSQKAVDAGIPLHPGSVVTNVMGKRQVKKAVVSKWDGKNVSATPHVLECNLIAVSGGFSPAVHLHSQSGGKNKWDEVNECFVPGDNPQGAVSVGSGNGTWLLRDCLNEALDVAVQVAGGLGFSDTAESVPDVADGMGPSVEPLWRVPTLDLPEKAPKQFVDFQTDVSVSDIRLAAREGFHNVEHVKRYTALGFGTDQGKLSNINGMAILAETLGKTIPEVGTTTFRPAYTPVSFGACAGENTGELYDPVRKTAIHSWHEQATSQFEVVGQWLRPWYFPKSGETLDQSVARECMAVRNSVGIMDASTLGKIDVFGPDAATFLERMYTHDIGKMKPNKCAYGILLGEDGMVMDDGVMARLEENHYYLTTTTGGAAAVYSWLEFWLQTEWPELEVYLTSVTDHYSTIAVAGPNSRKVVQAAGCDIDIEKTAFPFMSVRKATVADVPVDLFRVSFSGELAYEINVDSRYALHIWRHLVQVGGEYDITPYGTETMHVLRAEKGFPIIGQDTDGSITPVDLGMNWLLSNSKDFVGKRSLSREDSCRDDRKQFVGLVPVDGTSVVREGAQLITNTQVGPPTPMRLGSILIIIFAFFAINTVVFAE